MDVIVQNGHFYEAQLPVKHCPSVSGCRSVIRQANANNIFQLTENFVLTLKVNTRDFSFFFLFEIIFFIQQPGLTEKQHFSGTQSQKYLVTLFIGHSELSIQP